MPTPAQSLSDVLSNNLRRLREAAGLTQEELAAKAKVSRTAIARAELGMGGMHIRTIGEVAEALGVEASALLERTTETQAKQATGVRRGR